MTLVKSTRDGRIVGAETVTWSITKSKSIVVSTTIVVAVKNFLAVSESQISTGGLFQSEGAAWLNERLAVSVLTAGLERRSWDDDRRSRVGM